jgi:hypothetical protein
MNNQDKIIILFTVIIIIIYLIYISKFYINIFILISRGIITPNEFWWKINDVFIDKHEISDYLDEYRIGNHNISLLGSNFRIINNIDDVRYILENSPKIFKRGNIKYNFFKTFMPNNVGITYETDIWQKRRNINENILGTNIIKYDLITNLSYNIISIVNSNKNYSLRENFVDLGKKITKLIVFGNIDISNKVFDLIKTPSFFELAFSTENNNNNYKEWNDILQKSKIDNMSLVGKLKELQNTFDNETIDQIPHWIFPIFGSISVTLPRLLLLDSLYKNNLEDVPIRNKILETLRLFNPVVTLFRLDSQTNNEYLIFVQMFLRDPKYFPDPHKYNPTRWNDKNLEFQMYSLMFSQGPQICPGKNLILFLLEILFIEVKPFFLSKKILDINDLPDSQNPFDLF